MYSIPYKPNSGPPLQPAKVIAGKTAAIAHFSPGLLLPLIVPVEGINVPATRFDMTANSINRIALWALTIGLLEPHPAEAVILYGDSDPAYNTVAPTGALTNSGWQLQGQWGVFLGTPISPRHFISASHVGGTIGDIFLFRGATYTTTAMYDDPNSDLRIWRVCGEFPAFAPLYDGASEIRKTLVVFGRGTQRGAPIVMSDLFGPATKGWLWGPTDSVQRWGTNVVSAVINGDALVPLGGVAVGPVGDLLQATFDADAGADEAHLSSGDSSGGLFIEEGGVWKLAGINYGVEALFNTNNAGPGFFAAITDKGGLYSGGPGNWSQTPDLPPDLPSALYATRIASNLPWIRGVVDATPPSDPVPQIESAPTVVGPYVLESAATIDPNTRSITIACPAENCFFRLSGCSSLRIVQISVVGANLVLQYQ
jgi:hypothetical protein